MLRAATAAERGVAVIAYDRFISGAPLDYFVAYDGERVGHLQGEALVDAVGSDLAPDQGVLLVNGAISAMRAAGLDPVPPVTGQDAELAAVQRIVAGNQYMTVYKAISQQARLAAELAVRLLRGELPVGTARVEGVPAVLLTPVAVTRDNVASVIVHGGVHTAEEICTPVYRQACLDVGILEEEDT